MGSGSGPIWRCYLNLLDDVGDYCVDDNGEATACEAPDPADGHYCSRDAELTALISPRINQAALDAYCQDTVQNEHEDCVGRIYARKGLDVSGSGPIWRCYLNLLDDVGDYCVDDNGEATACEAPDPADGHYCSRDAELTALISPRINQAALDAYCQDTVQNEHEDCVGRIYPRKGLDVSGSGPIWR